MFQYRLDAFVITFLKSNAQPIGEVIEYVIRIEFQARGSPHAHTLIWIKDAPKLGYAEITEHDETTLKARVTTLDDPDHFTDALHVYGTNQQADHYNATMLQKLDTPKYVIKSSDITRDRDTRQVKISLDGKKTHGYRRTTKSLNHC